MPEESVDDATLAADSAEANEEEAVEVEEEEEDGVEGLEDEEDTGDGNVAPEEGDGETQADLVCVCMSLRTSGVLLDNSALMALRSADKEDALAVLQELRGRIPEVRKRQLNASSFVKESLDAEAAALAMEGVEDEYLAWAEEAEAEYVEEEEEEEAEEPSNKRLKSGKDEPFAPRGRILRGGQQSSENDVAETGAEGEARKYDKLIKDDEDLADTIANLKKRGIVLNADALAALRATDTTEALGVLDSLSDKGDVTENHSAYVIKYLTTDTRRCNPALFKLRMGQALRTELEDQDKRKGKGKSKGPTGPKPEGCTTLCVKGLAFEATEMELLEFFEKLGHVQEVRVLKDRETGESKGIAFVDFGSGNDDVIDEAVKLAGKDFMGRPLRLDYAQPKGNKAKGKGKGKKGEGKGKAGKGKEAKSGKGKGEESGSGKSKGGKGAGKGAKSKG